MDLFPVWASNQLLRIVTSRSTQLKSSDRTQHNAILMLETISIKYKYILNHQNKLSLTLQWYDFTNLFNQNIDFDHLPHRNRRGQVTFFLIKGFSLFITERT